MNRNPIQTGIAFSAKLIGENGTVQPNPDTSENLCKTRWISIESPVAPAGYSPPQATNVR